MKTLHIQHEKLRQAITTASAKKIADKIQMNFWDKIAIKTINPIAMISITGVPKSKTPIRTIRDKIANRL